MPGQCFPSLYQLAVSQALTSFPLFLQQSVHQAWQVFDSFLQECASYASACACLYYTRLLLALWIASSPYHGDLLVCRFSVFSRLLLKCPIVQEHEEEFLLWDQSRWDLFLRQTLLSRVCVSEFGRRGIRLGGPCIRFIVFTDFIVDRITHTELESIKISRVLIQNQNQSTCVSF